MKTVAALALTSLSLALSVEAAQSSSTAISERDGEYSVTERGPHHRIWSSLSWKSNHLGKVVARTNSYVELATGLNYRSPDTGEWQESDPSFELSTDGYAVARHCQHSVIVSPDLNDPDGVVDLRTPDGQRLRSGILGLNLFCPVSGKSLQVAGVRGVAGTLVSSNEIVWFDAFDGLRANVRVRNERRVASGCHFAGEILG